MEHNRQWYVTCILAICFCEGHLESELVIVPRNCTSAAIDSNSRGNIAYEFHLLGKLHQDVRDVLYGMLRREIQLDINDLFNFYFSRDRKEVDIGYLSCCWHVKETSFYDGDASCLSIMHLDNEALSLFDRVRILDRGQFELSFNTSGSVSNALINNLDGVGCFINANR